MYWQPFANTNGTVNFFVLTSPLPCYLEADVVFIEITWESIHPSCHCAITTSGPTTTRTTYPPSSLALSSLIFLLHLPLALFSRTSVPCIVFPHIVFMCPVPSHL